MQTFLPYRDFVESAKCIDKKRCFKQVVEVKQMLCILRAENLPEDWIASKTWNTQPFKNHPAVLMWKGYEESLKVYYNTFLKTCLLQYEIKTSLPFLNVHDVKDPWWLGNEDFHRAYRARLIDKYRDFYLPKFPNDEKFNDGKYFWPVMDTKTFRII